VTVVIKICRTTGNTRYEFEIVKDQGGALEYSSAEEAATQFENWLSAQPERQADYDVRHLREGAR